MAGRTVTLTVGIAAASGVGDQLVTQAADSLITQAGDLLVTQSSDGLLSIHDMTVGVVEYTKTVDLLAGIAATDLVEQPLVTQAVDKLLTQAGNIIILQALAAASGIAVLEPSVAITGS